MLTKVPYLVVISSPRTGSNFLLDMLAAQEGVLNLGELFLENDRLVPQEIKDLSKEATGDREKLSAIKMAQPRRALDFLDTVTGSALAVLKIQSKQLPSVESFRQVLKDALGVIFLNRNELGVWTSRELVDTSNKWWAVNTEGSTVHFTWESFADSASRRLKKLEKLEALAISEGVDVASMNYSALQGFATPQLLWNHLRRQLPALPQTVTKATWEPRIHRQDTRLPIDRISNREETVKILTKNGLGRLIDNDESLDPSTVIAALAGATTKAPAAPEPSHRGETGDVKIAAGGVFSQDSDIVPVVIAHLISQGITDFFLAFHRAQGGFAESLIEAFAGVASFTVFTVSAKKLQQAAITTLLARAAKDAEFDVFLPFDGDEFFDSVHAQRTLRQELEQWYSCSEEPSQRIDVANYAQRQHVEKFSALDLETVNYRIVPQPQNGAYLAKRLQPHFKIVMRLSEFDADGFVNIESGNHFLWRNGVKLAHQEKNDTFPIVCRHLPWRSRESSLSRVRPERISSFLSTPPSIPLEQGTEDSDAVWERSWMEYSVADNFSPHSSAQNAAFRLVPDGAFREIFANLVAAGFDVENAWCRPRLNQAAQRKSESIEAVSPNSELFLMSALTLIERSIDALHSGASSEKPTSRESNESSIPAASAGDVKRLRDELSALEAQKAKESARVAHLLERVDRLTHNLQRTKLSLARHEKDVKDLRSSRSWRLTEPLRQAGIVLRRLIGVAR